MSAPTPSELSRVYARRFRDAAAYRQQVWRVLTAEFFQAFVPADATILDLGCGYGEFINHIAAARKFAMDLNPDARGHLAPGITFLEQDCSQKWGVPEGVLDVVFTSNFFEHLPDKPALAATLLEAFRALKPGGRLVAMGPNIKFTQGRYWDFWDHHVALTELSLTEVLEVSGFQVERKEPRFLPYTMVSGPRYPVFFLSLYLRLPLLWRLKGEQFLLVAVKPSGHV